MKDMEEVEEKQTDFDGNLSQHNDSKIIKDIPRCTNRISTARKLNKNERSIGNKVQCNVLLQQMFFVFFNDLKLLSSLQNWEEKLNVAESTLFSKGKKDIAGIILLKKGFMHGKLMQNKKCQEAFQKARNISESIGIKLVACYQLITLYISNK